MKGTLKLEDGKELTIEIGEELIVDINGNAFKLIKEPKKTGYERVEINKYYFSVSTDNEAIKIHNDGLPYDEEQYINANYYSDKTVAENNARADALMRKLRRFTVEHRKKDINWDDCNQSKYEIYYYHPSQSIKTSPYQNCQVFGTIYFDTAETAKLAIEEFKDELIWYFTKYKDSL